MMAIDERVDALEATTAFRTHNRSALATIALGAALRSEVMRRQADGWAHSVGRSGVMPPAGRREPTLQGQVEAVSVKAHETQCLWR